MRTIDLCLEERVDALLIAGDLYDGDQTSMKTARFLAEQLARLDQAGVNVFIVRGNHDALSRITRELTFPESVRLFRGRADAIPVMRSASEHPIVIHGLSFTQPHAPESLIGRYKPPVDGAVNIGMMHTSVGGSPEHDPYAPCSIAELKGAGFDYWALGHIHRRWVQHGSCAIVMPGIPQGRDINEAGPKSVTLVTVHDDRSVQIDERVVSVAQFEWVSVDAASARGWPELLEGIAEELQRTLAGIHSDHLVARVRLAGTTPLAWRVRRDLDLLVEDIDLRFATRRRCWIEKVEAACHPPRRGDGLRADPLTELHKLIETDVLASEALQAEAIAIARELQGQLPPELRRLLGEDEDTFRESALAFAREGSEDVLARLQARGEEDPV